MSRQEPLRFVPKSTQPVAEATLHRRSFLRHSTLLALAAATGCASTTDHDPRTTIKIVVEVSPHHGGIIGARTADDGDLSYPWFYDRRIHLPHSGDFAKIARFPMHYDDDHDELTEFWWKGDDGWRHGAAPGPGEGSHATLLLEFHPGDASIVGAMERNGGSWRSLMYETSEVHTMNDGESRIAHLKNHCCWRKTPTGWRCSHSFC